MIYCNYWQYLRRWWNWWWMMKTLSVFLISGSADRAAGDEEDRARAADGAHLPGGVSGDGVPGRLRLHVGQARQETTTAAAREPRECDTEAPQGDICGLQKSFVDTRISKETCNKTLRLSRWNALHASRVLANFIIADRKKRAYSFVDLWCIQFHEVDVTLDASRINKQACPFLWANSFIHNVTSSSKPEEQA